jgi:ADP-heptose:LPS heptosyltransferase
MRLRTQRTVDKYLGALAIALLRPTAMVLGRLLRRDHRLTVGGEVVWIKMLGGGSLLLALPMLLGFRRAHPGTRLVLITTPGVRPFAELMGVFDEYRIIDVGSLPGLLSSAARAWARTFHADCIVDLEIHSRLTTAFATMTLARNRVSFWLEDIFWRRGLASHLVFFNRASGSYHFYDRIADLFGFPVADRAACRESVIRACGIVAASPVEGRVAVGFACSDLGQERMLDPAQWLSVFREHLRPELRSFVFLGGPADRARGEDIIAALRAELPGLTFENRCGELTLRQSLELLSGTREFWGIDSSLLHCARIFGLRCLSYWGPTDPTTRLRATWQLEERVVYRKIACSPCVHTAEEPPCRGDNRCIQGLFDPSKAPLGWTPAEYPARETVA